MARPSKKGKLISAREIAGVLADSIRNVKNKTADLDSVKVINNTVRELCRVNKEQRETYIFLKSHPEAIGNFKLLE